MSILTRCVFLSLLLAASFTSAAAQTASFTLYLAGDGGASTSVDGTPALAMLRDSLAACDASCGVLFLGDNVYTSGLAPEGHPDRARGEQILDAQIEVARLASGPAVFLPGNHDSGGGGVGGDLRRLQDMEAYVIERLGEQAFLPRGGDPGPVVLYPHPAVALVIINSQWWFEADHRGERTGRLPESSRRDIVEMIDALIRENAGRHVILATHHPVRSAGDHALYSLGFSPVALARQVLGAPQDYSDRHYQRYRHDILSIAERHPDLIIVSGHEHNLTYFDSPGHHIVSGSLSKPEWASDRTGATFASGDAGFAALRFTDDHRAILSFSAVGDAGIPALLFQRHLTTAEDHFTPDPHERASSARDFAPPPPAFEVDAAPTYSEWRGAGGGVSLRYTIPDTRIQPRIIADLNTRYDHNTRAVTTSGGIEARRSNTAFGIRLNHQHAARLNELIGNANADPVSHLGFAIEPTIVRHAYGGMLSLRMSAAARYHRTESEAASRNRPDLRKHAVQSIAMHLSPRISTLDSEVVPEGGVDARISVGAIIYEDRIASAQFGGALRYYRSFGARRPLTASLRSEARLITGEPTFFDAANLSSVRGYPELDAIGRGAITGALEMRQTLVHFDRRRIQPIGISAFIDAGALSPLPRGRFLPGSELRLLFDDDSHTGDVVTRVSAGLGVWGSITRRTVLHAAIIFTDDHPRIGLMIEGW